MDADTLGFDLLYGVELTRLARREGPLDIGVTGDVDGFLWTSESFPYSFRFTKNSPTADWLCQPGK